jgi:hypothetical protein
MNWTLLRHFALTRDYEFDTACVTRCLTLDASLPPQSKGQASVCTLFDLSVFHVLPLIIFIVRFRTCPSTELLAKYQGTFDVSKNRSIKSKALLFNSIRMTRVSTRATVTLRPCRRVRLDSGNRSSTLVSIWCWSPRAPTCTSQRSSRLAGSLRRWSVHATGHRDTTKKSRGA